MSLVTMRELLERAEKKQIGCGAFNVGSMEMVRGVIRAAEAEKTPIIMQIAEARLEYSPLELMGPMMVQAAWESKVPVAVHLDHGRSLGVIEKALEFGFTSVMFDGSALPLEENIRRTREIASLAAEYSASLEAELGRVGGSEGEGQEARIQYTSPYEARRFCEETGVDALAVAIGNAHGAYPAAPKLAFDRLEEIHSLTDTHLVLHGGSGISGEDFQKAIGCGIRKVNIATASFEALTGHAAAYFNSGQQTNFFALSEAMTEGVCQTVRRHIQIFGKPACAL